MQQALEVLHEGILPASSCSISRNFSFLGSLSDFQKTTQSTSSKKIRHAQMKQDHKHRERRKRFQGPYQENPQR